MFTDPKNIYSDTSLVNICISINFPQKNICHMDLAFWRLFSTNYMYIVLHFDML